MTEYLPIRLEIQLCFEHLVWATEYLYRQDMTHIAGKKRGLTKNRVLNWLRKQLKLYGEGLFYGGDDIKRLPYYREASLFVRQQWPEISEGIF